MASSFNEVLVTSKEFIAAVKLGERFGEENCIDGNCVVAAKADSQVETWHRQDENITTDRKSRPKFVLLDDFTTYALRYSIRDGEYTLRMQHELSVEDCDTLRPFIRLYDEYRLGSSKDSAVFVARMKQETPFQILIQIDPENDEVVRRTRKILPGPSGGNSDEKRKYDRNLSNMKRTSASRRQQQAEYLTETLRTRSPKAHA